MLYLNSGLVPPLYCIIRYRNFQKNNYPMKYHTAEIMSPRPAIQYYFLFFFCLVAFKKNHFCRWCSALPIRTLKLGVVGVGKISVVSCGWLVFWRIRWDFYPDLCMGFIFLTLHPVRLPVLLLLPSSSSRRPATCSHTTCSHTTESHTTCSHTICSHTIYSHTIYSYTICHTQFAHVQLTHTQFAHTQLTHTQFAHTQLTHLQLTHTQLAHTQLTHVHSGRYGTCVAGVALGDV